MKYDLKNPLDVSKAETRFKRLVELQKNIELKEVMKPRNLSQNAYLHVLFTLWGVEFGWSVSEAKRQVKIACPFGTYEKKGVKFLVETHLMDEKQISDFIDWFRNWSGMNGLHLMTSEDYLMNKFAVDREVEQYKQFM